METELKHWVVSRLTEKDNKSLKPYIRTKDEKIIQPKKWEDTPAWLNHVACNPDILAEDDYKLPYESTGTNRREITCPECKHWQEIHDPEIHRLVNWELRNYPLFESFSCGEVFNKNGDYGATLPGNVTCSTCREITPGLQLLGQIELIIKHKNALPPDFNVESELYNLEHKLTAYMEGKGYGVNQS